MSDAVETMAYAYETNSTDEAYSHPWHIGFTGDRSRPVHPDMTPDDMIKAAGLDWEVKRRPARITIDNINIPAGVDGLYRVDNEGNTFYEDGKPQILTLIPNKWQECQNSVFADFFREFCLEGSMEMNTMGSLDNGRTTFALAKLKQDFSILRGKDVVESYMLFVNPHQYGKSISVSTVMTRVVCMNTLVAALREDAGMMVRVSHRNKFDPEEVKQLMDINMSYMTEYKSAAELLCTKRYNDTSLKEYFNAVFPITSKDKEAYGHDLSRPARKAMEVMDTQPGAEMGEGTFWQAFNAATYYLDHESSANEQKRLKSGWFGGNRKRKAVALNVARDMAEAA